jgi:hypothetical protein
VDRVSIVTQWDYDVREHLTGVEAARCERAEERTANAKRGVYFRHEVLRELLAKGEAEQREWEAYRQSVASFVHIVKQGWGWFDAGEAGIWVDGPGTVEAVGQSGRHSRAQAG